ncbi:MAG: LuxR C-terminal-related transcriptional regulator, partial [Bacteroidales bacterium]
DGLISVYDTTEVISVLLNKLLTPNQSVQNNIKQELLSEREKDVLKLLVKGCSNKEIAEELNISINTVITHRKNISGKTGIKSVSGLTIFAVTQNLISL